MEKYERITDIPSSILAPDLFIALADVHDARYTNPRLEGIGIALDILHHALFEQRFGPIIAQVWGE